MTSNEDSNYHNVLDVQKVATIVERSSDCSPRTRLPSVIATTSVVISRMAIQQAVRNEYDRSVTIGEVPELKLPAPN